MYCICISLPLFTKSINYLTTKDVSVFLCVFLLKVSPPLVGGSLSFRGVRVRVRAVYKVGLFDRVAVIRCTARSRTPDPSCVAQFCPS